MSERYRRFGTSTLGRGSYGHVYAAWDSQESCTVAIIVQKRESDEAVREMMFSEHPHPQAFTAYVGCFRAAG